MTDEQIKNAILNAIHAAVLTYHSNSSEISGDTERDALWLAALCAAAAEKGIEGR